MRIGVDLYAFNPASTDGVSTFALGLIEGLLAHPPTGEEVVLLVSKLNNEFFAELYDGRNVQLFCVPVASLARYVNRILWILSWITRQYRLRYWYERLFRKRLSREIDGKVDALIVPTTVFNFFALQVRTVLCVHDIQHEFHPENFTHNQLILRWASYRLSCARADVIQVSSRYIQKCLLEKFEFLSRECFLIAPEGVDGEKFSAEAHSRDPKALPHSVRKKFLIYPAQIWKHKNHYLLVKALAVFRNRMGFEIPCVLIGHDYGHWAMVRQSIDRLKLQSVFYLGRVDFAELIWLYKHCTAVLALGLHESSSLPVREGASFGKPLICADIPPNVEAAELLRLNLFPHDNPDALADLFIALNENDSRINGDAVQNKILVASLRWPVIARLYRERLAACATRAHISDT